MTTCILPCAGLGTRVGMSPNQSKELLLDPINNRPLIDHSLDLCSIFGLSPVVVTRTGKKDLIDYLSNKGNVHLIIKDDAFFKEKEWPDSVMESKIFWQEDNILILPDTRFKPIQILNQIDQSLKLGANCVFGLHKVKDPEKWSVIEDYNICEKPINSTSSSAWGLIGFKGYYGETLFNYLKTRNTWNSLDKASFLFLEEFKDITRAGKVDSY